MTLVHHRRTAPRITMTLELELLRQRGGAVKAKTIDLGAGGMRVACERPLAVDEVLHFGLGIDEDRRLAGQARVLRMQGHNVYALRFEDLDERDRLLLTQMAVQTA